MMNNYVRDTSNGRNAYNEVASILQNNQARKAAENSLQQKLASLPYAEISSGNRTNAATEALADLNNKRAGLSAGFMQGSGIVPMSTALNAGLEKLTGQSNPSAYEAAEEVERARRSTPNAFSAGNVAGNIALMTALGEGVGAGAKAVGASGRLASMAANALTFGGTEAIHGMGDVATGNITPGRYAKNIGTSAIGGAAGGLASELTGTGIGKVLRDKKMMTPFMEFVRQTASGTAFGGANLAASQAIAYGTNDDQMKMTRRQAAEQMASVFGFSMINGAIRALNTTASAKADLQRQVDEATAVYESLTKGEFSEEEYLQRINTLMEYTDNLRASVNSQYLAGNQNAVNNMNDALDLIQQGLRDRVGSVDAARAGAAAAEAAGNPGNNLLVDNINPGVDTVPPSLVPEPPSAPPSTEDTLQALADQAAANKEAQRQMLYEAGKNQEQNIRPLMDSATMLTEEEKLAALRQGNQDAAKAEVEAIRSESAQPLSKEKLAAKNAGVDIAKTDDFVNQVIQKRGRTDYKYNYGRIASVPQKVADFVSKATGGRVNITGKRFAFEGGKLYHELKSHSQQYGPDDIYKAIDTMMAPDIVEDVSSGDARDQRNTVGFAKKFDGEMVVVAAVGGKRNPNVVPEQILKFKEETWNKYQKEGKTLKEIVYAEDVKRTFTPEEIDEIKKNIKDIRFDVDQKITKDSLKELYNLHLSDLDEINDLREHISTIFDDLRKNIKSTSTLTNKVESIVGNLISSKESKSSIQKQIIDFIWMIY